MLAFGEENPADDIAGGNPSASPAHGSTAEHSLVMQSILGHKDRFCTLFNSGLATGFGSRCHEGSSLPSIVLLRLCEDAWQFG
jgi:hypothetical protein